MDDEREVAPILKGAPEVIFGHVDSLGRLLDLHLYCHCSSRNEAIRRARSVARRWMVQTYVLNDDVYLVQPKVLDGGSFKDAWREGQELRGTWDAQAADSWQAEQDEMKDDFIREYKSMYGVEPPNYED